MNKIWEKQPYESKISFGYFQKYYLLQPSPRSLSKAYRQFLIETGKKNHEQAKKIYAPGSWNNWAKAKNNNGSRIENSYTWEERADEYDKSLFMLNEEEYSQARKALLQKEINDVEEQMLLWDKLSHSLALYIDSAAEEAEKNQKKFNPSQYINKIKEFWKWREEIAVFQRRTIGLPAVIKQDPKSDNKDKKTKIEWEEPLNKDDEVGVGKDQLEEN
jgi:hypothetical protein